MMLPWLILIPLISAFFCWQIEQFKVYISHWIALIAVGLVLMLSIQLWLHEKYYMNYCNLDILQWQSEFILPWIPRFGISIHLALDGLSLLMITLTSLLSMLAVLCSWKEIKRYQSLFNCNLLLIITSVIGVFLAVDMFLFFLFWEMMLVPICFLIALWGYKDRNSNMRAIVAIKIFVYSQVSSLLMLIAILALVSVHYNITGIWTFNYEELLRTPMSHNMEYFLMLCFCIAFSVKMPVVPLHGWISDAHFYAPTAGSVDLSGFLLKTAVYGLLRFVLPLFPNVSIEFAPIAMWLGLISIFYGACIACAQYDIKRLLSYSSVSHMGFMMIAIYSCNQLSHQGLIVHIIAHSLSIAGLFIICGQLHKRLYTRDMRLMGGLWSQIKWLPAISMFFAISVMGIPGTGNFIGEFMILFGNFKIKPTVSILSIFGLMLSSVYILMMLHRIFFGKTHTNKIIIAYNLSKMSFRELLITVIPIILLLLSGFYPQWIVNKSYSAINNIQQHIINSSIGL